MKKKRDESTGKNAASNASKVLRNPDSSKTAKSAAGSALVQRKTKDVTGSAAGTAAAKTLRDPKSSKAAKSAAGSALTQRPDRKK